MPVRDQHYDRRVDARKDPCTAVLPDTEACVPAGFRPGGRATATTELLRLVPQDQRPGLRHQVCLVGRQGTAEVAKVVKLPEFGEGSSLACVYLEGEYRPIAVHTEEDAFLLLQVLAHVLAARQNGMQGFTGCEALVAPHRHEQRLVTVDSLVQPLRVFAPMTGAVDERPGEYVVTIHGIRPI